METLENEDKSRPFLSSSPSNGVDTEKEGWVAKNPGSPYWGDGKYFLLKLVKHVFDKCRVVFMNKGGKFLKKLWCCVGGGNKVIWFYQLS